jgi:sodium-independent sulfate anion transporter 11
VYQFPTSLDYINSARFTEELTNFVHAQTIPSDQATSDPPNEGLLDGKVLGLTTLKTVVLDFDAVHSIDVTAVQQLVDLKKQLDTYVRPEVLEWHFVRIKTQQVRRALQSSAFGIPDGLPREVSPEIRGVEAQLSNPTVVGGPAYGRLDGEGASP